MPPKTLFVFEGPDAVGKTTQAQIMARLLGCPYFHVTCTKSLAPAMTDYQVNVVQNVKHHLDGGNNYVLDRLWPSEHCYAPVFRSESAWQDSVDRIGQELMGIPVVYVFCLDEKGAANAADRHEKMLDPAHPYKREDYIKVYNRYANLSKLMFEQNAAPVERLYFDDRLLVADKRSIIAYREAMATALIKKYIDPAFKP